MERTTFLEHYRIDGAPQELSRTGTVITYKAVDDRFGESVVLKLIPVAGVDPAARERIEGEASAAQKLNHVNIAKVFDFGNEDGDFVYVSEYVEGETLSSWVEEHGPMPADAVLRVALQIVEALSAASSHRLTHRAIQPSNLMIVPGTTAEGGWPFVKLMNFGLAGIKSASRTDSSSGELESNGDDEGEVDFSVAPQFASPEQLQHGTSDFRSEIYSLGATMYFLLSGAAPSKVRRQQLRPFPKALRNLLAHMLRNNPDERPQDPVALAETIRECLLRIERRQAFGYRFGTPLAAVIPGESRTPRSPLAQVWFGVLAFAALLLTAAVVSAFLLPDIIPFWHRTTATDKIGVPIGVPDESSKPTKATSAAPIVANQPLTNASRRLWIQIKIHHRMFSRHKHLMRRLRRLQLLSTRRVQTWTLPPKLRRPRESPNLCHHRRLRAITRLHQKILLKARITHRRRRRPLHRSPLPPVSRVRATKRNALLRHRNVRASLKIHLTGSHAFGAARCARSSLAPRLMEE